MAGFFIAFYLQKPLVACMLPLLLLRVTSITMEVRQPVSTGFFIA